MLTVAEAARRASRDPETIRRWIRAGKLTAWKVGGQHVIDEDDLVDAARGIFTETSDAGPVAGGIVAEIHRGRAGRGHDIREATAPYVAGWPAARPVSAADVLLPHVVGRIVRAVDPHRIILFGSRERGDERHDSDYDLLVILDRLDDRRASRIAIRSAFADLPIAADILVASIDEVDGRIPGRPTGATFWALQDGRGVYDRADA